MNFLFPNRKGRCSANNFHDCWDPSEISPSHDTNLGWEASCVCGFFEGSRHSALLDRYSNVSIKYPGGPKAIK